MKQAKKKRGKKDTGKKCNRKKSMLNIPKIYINKSVVSGDSNTNVYNVSHKPKAPQAQPSRLLQR